MEDLNEYFGLRSWTYMLGKQGSLPTLVSHYCHKEDKSLKTRHSCACAVQRPFKPELTSSNSWKTHMVFLRTWYIILFTVNTRGSIVPHERFETHWWSKTMEKRKLQETKIKNHSGHAFTCSLSELRLSTPRNIEIVACLNCWSWNSKFSELFSIFVQQYE